MVHDSISFVYIFISVKLENKISIQLKNYILAQILFLFFCLPIPRRAIRVVCLPATVPPARTTPTVPTAVNVPQDTPALTVARTTPACPTPARTRQPVSPSVWTTAAPVHRAIRVKSATGTTRVCWLGSAATEGRVLTLSVDSSLAPALQVTHYLSIIIIILGEYIFKAFFSIFISSLQYQ